MSEMTTQYLKSSISRILGKTIQGRNDAFEKLYKLLNLTIEWAEDNFGGKYPSIKEVEANYTLVKADTGTLINGTSAGAIQITIPADTVDPITTFVIGSTIDVFAGDDGAVTFAGAVGVTIIAADDLVQLRVKGSSASAIKVAANTWLLVGDLA